MDNKTDKTETRRSFARPKARASKFYNTHSIQKSFMANAANTKSSVATNSSQPHFKNLFKPYNGDLFGTRGFYGDAPVYLSRMQRLDTDEKVLAKRASIMEASVLSSAKIEFQDEQLKSQQASDLENRKQIAIALLSLSHTPANGIKLIEEGSLMTILSMLSLDNSEVNEVCAETLMNISTSVNARVRMVKDGALPAVLTLSSSKDKTVKRYCVNTLCNLSCEVGCESQIVSDGAVTILEATGLKYKDFEQTCATCLANLVCVDSLYDGIETVLPALINLTMTGRDLATARITAKALCKIASFRFQHDVVITDSIVRVLSVLINCGDDEILYMCSQAICNLSFSRGSREKLTNGQVVSSLSRLIVLDDSNVRLNCAITLKRLASDQECHTKIVEDGGLDVLFSLVEFPEHEVRSRCAGALKELCLHASKEVKRALMDRDIVPKLLTAGELLVDKKEAKKEKETLTKEESLVIRSTKKDAAWALCALLVEDAETLVEQGVLSALLRLRHENDAMLQKWSAFGLYNLACQEWGQKHLRGHKKATKALVKLMKLENAETRSYAVAALCALCVPPPSEKSDEEICLVPSSTSSRPIESSSSSLSLDTDSKDMIEHLIECGMLSALIRCLKCDNDEFPDQLTARNVCATLQFLMGNEEVCKKLVESKIIGALMGLASSSRADIQLWVGTLLCELSRYSEIRKRLVDDGVLSMVVKMMSLSDKRIHGYGATFFRNLSFDACLKTSLVDQGVIAAAIGLSNSYNEEIKRDCCATLCNLSTEDSCGQQMRKHKAIQALVVTALVRSDSPVTKNICLKALSNLWNNESLREDLIGGGFLWALTVLSRQENKDTRNLCAALFCNALVVESARKKVLEESGAIRSILSLLQIGNEDIAANCGGAISNLVFGGIDVIPDLVSVRTSLIQCLTSLIMTADSRIVGASVGVMCMLSKEPSIQEEMLKQDCLDAIFHACGVESSSDSSDMRVHCCTILYNLATSSIKSAASALVKGGIMKGLLQLIDEVRRVQVCRGMIGRTLLALTKDTDVIEMMVDDGLIIDLMKSLVEVGDKDIMTTEILLSCLSVLSTGPNPSRLVETGSVRVLKLLLPSSSMKHNPRPNMSARNSTTSIGSAGSTPGPLLHNQHDRVRHSASVLLHNLATHVDTRGTMAMDGALDILSELCRKPGDNRHLLAHTFTMLSEDDIGSKELCDNPMALESCIGLARPVVSTMTANKCVVCCLRNLSETDELCVAVANSGGAALLTSLVPIGDKYLRRWCASALANLSRSAECHDVVVEEGVLPSLVTLSQMEQAEGDPKELIPQINSINWNEQLLTMPVNLMREPDMEVIRVFVDKQVICGECLARPEVPQTFKLKPSALPAYKQQDVISDENANDVDPLKKCCLLAQDAISENPAGLKRAIAQMRSQRQRQTQEVDQNDDTESELDSPAIIEIKRKRSDASDISSHGSGRGGGSGAHHHHRRKVNQPYSTLPPLSPFQRNRPHTTKSRRGANNESQYSKGAQGAHTTKGTKASNRFFNQPNSAVLPGNSLSSTLGSTGSYKRRRMSLQPVDVSSIVSGTCERPSTAGTEVLLYGAESSRVNTSASSPSSESSATSRSSIGSFLGEAPSLTLTIAPEASLYGFNTITDPDLLEDGLQPQNVTDQISSLTIKPQSNHHHDHDHYVLPEVAARMAVNSPTSKSSIKRQLNTVEDTSATFCDSVFSSNSIEELPNFSTILLGENKKKTLSVHSSHSTPNLTKPRRKRRPTSEPSPSPIRVSTKSIDSQQSAKGLNNSKSEAFNTMGVGGAINPSLLTPIKLRSRNTSASSNALANINQIPKSRSRATLRTKDHPSSSMSKSRSVSSRRRTAKRTISPKKSAILMKNPLAVGFKQDIGVI